MSKYFTSKIVIQVTHRADSIEEAELAASELADRVLFLLPTTNVHIGHNVVNAFVLSVEKEEIEDD